VTGDEMQMEGKIMLGKIMVLPTMILPELSVSLFNL